MLPGAGSDDSQVAGWTDAVAAVGFIAVAVKPLPPPELPYAVVFAEHVLHTELSKRFSGERRTRLLDLAAQLAAARSNRAPRVMLFAERPS